MKFSSNSKNKFRDKVQGGSTLPATELGENRS